MASAARSFFRPGAVRLIAPLAVIAGVLAAVPATLAGGTPDDAAAFVKSLFERAKTLAAPEGEPDRQERLVAFVRSGVDVAAIARFSTGPFWKRASEAERDRFLVLFETFVAQTFGRRLGELDGQSIDVVKTFAVPANQENADMLVMSQLVDGSGRALGIDWRVRVGDAGPRIVDLIIEGISMAVAQRDEFVTVIRNGDGQFAALLARLEDWTARPENALMQQSATAGRPGAVSRH